tara:strand:- start:8 stop:574 length:567 start_codon:yes stop_codon:yes gene_type:complete
MRRSFTKFQQTEILGIQDYKCRLCSARFAKKVHPQFDHISGDKSDNRTENGQALCSNCHDAKSRKENVERGRTKKDFDIVEYCPLCGKTVNSKDYEPKEDDDGYEIDQDFQDANDWIECVKCDSEFKIIRHDPRNTRPSKNKKHEDVVKCCMSCGERWYKDEWGDSNDLLECHCGMKFYVWIKKYNEW